MRKFSQPGFSSSSYNSCFYNSAGIHYKSLLQFTGNLRGHNGTQEKIKVNGPGILHQFSDFLARGFACAIFGGVCMWCLVSMIFFSSVTGITNAFSSGHCKWISGCFNARTRISSKAIADRICIVAHDNGPLMRLITFD